MNSSLPTLRPCQRLLVTGGCGFIGAAFIRHLLTRAEDAPEKIVNLDALTYAAMPENLGEAGQDPRYLFVEGRIEDGALLRSLLKDHAIDAVVNFAAESHVDRSIDGPAPFIQTNILGTFEILEAIRNLDESAREKTHLHHISTDEVFGELGPEGFFTEASPYRPSSPYSASKAAADHLLMAYHRTYGLSITLSNASNNYGPGQHPEKLIPSMIQKALAGDKLPVYGDGKNVRDWIHVEDHVAAIWSILRHAPSGESYAVGGGCEKNNLEVVGLILDAVAAVQGSSREALQKLITMVPDRPGHDWRYAIDASKIRRDLGWQPKRILAESLRALVATHLK